MKTAMQELIEKLSMKSGDSFYALAFYHDNDKIIKEAIEKEREQIINAHIEGQPLYSCQSEKAEQYYNQTYN